MTRADGDAADAANAGDDADATVECETDAAVDADTGAR